MTYAPLLTGGRSLTFVARRRRERAGNALVATGAAVVLVALLVIPLFLGASIVAWLPLPDGAWARLGILFAGSAKAATCALVLAVPLALAAAIFSAQFATARFRAWLKPGLEILEAIPTVVLGLVAFATLAPWLKDNVATLLALVVLIPVLLFAAGFAFGGAFRRRAGWLPLVLVPILLAVVVTTVAIVGPLQRDAIVPPSPWNAVLVGLALGLAAIPMMFSVAEDALMQMPSTDVQAALALGATRWQAVRSIVLPAARPGLIAAFALGASRCLGETMIVLMASGNTPVGDPNPLAGLRSISADLALGMPEAAPPGGAYRTLLLAALVLFVLTFVLNLLAERARAHLRRAHATQALA
ncbi:MAG TPA: ABC transporter permease subunit [Rhodanobacteraceae bacterium]|nr:ABC transporter permease subunit [Rhodanobacteraceae bacterium]